MYPDWLNCKKSLLGGHGKAPRAVNAHLWWGFVIKSVKINGNFSGTSTEWLLVHCFQVKFELGNVGF